MSHVPDGPLGEAGARLLALVAQLHMLLDHLYEGDDGTRPDRDFMPRTLNEAQSVLNELDALLSAPVVSPNVVRDALYGLWQAVISQPDLSFITPPLHAAIERACDALGITGGLDPVISGWQPIATAPKDCELLLYGEYHSGARGLVQGAWNHGGAMHMPHWMGGIIRPTHWMPLPAAPVVTQEGE